MKRLFLFLLISAATLCSMSAQDLKGTVNDEQGHPVEFATVALRSLPDSSVITGVITDINGQFTIERKGTERGFVQISSVGYETQDIAVSAFAKEQSITLKSDNKVLDEVVVSKVRPKTTISGDAVVTSISGSVLEHAGNSLDVLSKIPGMISRNGTLEVVGRGEPLYYINGRRVTDNSELRNLMSEDIKSIDVVSNPGAEYGGEVRCVVRIRTVKRQGEGFSFAMTSQAAKHIYKCHDAEPSWSVLDLNYRKNGLDVLGKIVYFNQRFYQVSNIYGATYVMTADGHIKENVQDGYLNCRNHYAGWNVEGGVNYQINEQHSLGAKVSYGANGYANTKMILEDDIITDGVVNDHVYSLNDSETPTARSVNANLYYDGRINNLGINFNADFSEHKNERETDVTETSWTGPASLKTVSESDATMAAAKLIFSYPIWKGVLKFGAEEVYVSGDQAYSITHDEIPSSDADMSENTISGFAEYAFGAPFGQFSAGLRYEHVDFDYDNEISPEKSVGRKQDNWFPSFNFATKIKVVNLSLGYSTRVRRPRYDQMTTEVLYDNRFTYQTGDPTLLNEVQKTLSLNANWQWLTFTAVYEVVDHSIQQKAYPYNDEGIIMVQYANVDDAVRKISVYLNASPTFGVFNPRYTIGLQRQDLTTDILDPRVEGGQRRVTLNTPMFFVQANNAFRLKKSWLIDLDYQYTSDNDQLMSSITRATHCLNMAVSKSFLEHDALNIRLAWNDILDKMRYYFSTDYGNCKIVQDNNGYMPSLQLRASYRFNTANSKYKGTGAGQDAKQRM